MGANRVVKHVTVVIAAAAITVGSSLAAGGEFQAAAQPASVREAATRVTVPNVRCRRLDRAGDMLVRRGLRYRAVALGVLGRVNRRWVVGGQNPRPGARVRWGTKVLLFAAPSCKRAG